MKEMNKKRNSVFDNLTENLAGKTEVKQEVTDGTMKQSNFCEKEFFDTEILPMIEDISKKCKDRDIPFLMTVAISKDDENTNLCCVGNFPGARTPIPFRIAKDVLSEENPMLNALLAVAMIRKKSDTDEK